MKKNIMPFVICTHNDDCDDLERLKIYQTLPDDSAAKEGYIRVIDESGEDYLYPENYFILFKFPKIIEQEILAVYNIKPHQQSHSPPATPMVN
jgi:hypothetical protein